MIFVLLIVTASFRPAAPTVGDPITIVFEQPVVLDRSEAYEVMEHDGNQVVARTFKPEPFELSGRVGEVFFRKLIVPVGSVLRPDDDLKPAPLDPPVPPPVSRRPYVAIGIASGIAALAWLAAFLLARRARIAAMPVPDMPAADRFRLTVEQLRGDPAAPHRWAALADATRRYLASTDPSLGLQCTTAEILRRTRGGDAPLARILRQGDMEKFSPWGAQPGDFDAVAASALDLIPPAPVEVAA
jgi:hypothetical protein